jgi:predicted Rossmann fold nucleotide-binding protein DprA/Smf involved in DNA uptake
MDPADVLADLGTVLKPSDVDDGEAGPMLRPAVTLSGDDAKVAAALRGSGGSDVAALIEVTGMPPAAAMRAMTSLELLGVVSRRGQYVTLTPAGMAMTVKLDGG